jgi:hypothetical protein
MNLDDLKPLTRGVTAPAGAPSAAANLDNFMAQMRVQDQQRRRRVLGMALILFPVGLVFAVSGVTRPGGGELVGVGIMMAAAYMYLKSRGFGRVDYGAPAREFLAAAAKRYQFWGAKDVLAIIPLLVISLGGGLTIHEAAMRYLGEQGTQFALGGYLAFLIALGVFAAIVSRKQWRTETAALLEEIRRRQQQLENG